MTEDEADLFYAEVGRRVTELRTECGLSQTQVAEACGLTRSSIANLEAGRQRVPAHSLVSIARLFDVGLADLTGSAENWTAPASPTLDLLKRQGQEIARLKATIRAGRRALGDTCV